MKKLLTLIIVVLLGAIMTQTVPDKKAHKAAMMVAIKEYVAEETEHRIGDNILGDISKAIINGSAKLVLGSKLKVHNYYLFNTTTVRIDGKDQLMSVGVLGHVFTFDKEMLCERLQKGENIDEPDEEQCK